MKHPVCHLLYHAPTGKIKYPLEVSKANVIGRKTALNPPDVNILVDTTDDSMSRRHGQISILFGDLNEGYVYVLSDLDSRNGTTLFNKQRQEMKILPGDEVCLKDGFIIRMGATELTFEIVPEDNKTKLKF